MAKHNNLQEKDITSISQIEQRLASFSTYHELKKFDIEMRNKVRAILVSNENDSIRLINGLRKKNSGKELLQLDRVFRAKGGIIPELFPVSPQTKENYHRLDPIPIAKHLEIVDSLVLENKSKLQDFIHWCFAIGSCILQGDIEEADQTVGVVIDSLGYSHCLLRKAALIRALNSTDAPLPYVDQLFNNASFGSKNVITSSLLQCYQEEQDFLSMKRSIMGIRNRGISNKYTRDIARIPFHPFAKDEEDLCEMIQSNLQSSLIDALIIIKVNRHLLNESRHKNIFAFFDKLDIKSVHIDSIATQYLSKEDGESLFYKRSSAWLENSAIVQYRTLHDHFYDDPKTTYFEITDNLINRVSNWVNDIQLKDIVISTSLTSHSYEKVRILESKGVITKSSVFNYIIHRCEGFALISEDDLFELMGQTCDLVKTINPNYFKNLARNANSPISKIIFYLLIARKSKNEADDHYLRKSLQQIVKDKHNGKLVEFIADLAKRSQIVAKYTYEVCTEDFIAKLSHIISSSGEITETRASLHKWMGETTGEKSYLDRARTLLIDHQINKIRNEIDDNRIYVDLARFAEWINDELIHELNAVLTIMEHNNTLDNVATDESLLLHIIERSYEAFCGNNVFGIASYLGRRIRHGTFKGHLYSSVVISIEEQYSSLLKDPTLSTKWNQWKANYESCVDNIIKNRLHIESSMKRDGLLKPHLKCIGKSEIAMVCAQNLATDFLENKNTLNAVYFLTEYCWRLAEVDLKNVNSFLKSQKTNLIKSDFLTDFKNSAKEDSKELAKEFTRELQRQINEKLTSMYGWFKRPLSVSPKASLSLLYKAVVTEVKETFHEFNADTGFDENQDIEIVGGAYHVLYDAFYVVVYNAAKHGNPQGIVERKFSISYDSESGRCTAIKIVITSELRTYDNEASVNECLKISPDDDIANAQLSENRSGIRKLHHLKQSDSRFSIEEMGCENRKVIVSMSYLLEH